MSLFNYGNFILHSGEHSNFKIDCDALTDTDWEDLAKLVDAKYRFCAVLGVPTGGAKFAKALQQYCVDDAAYVLVVDDVLTTGGSMNQLYKKAREMYPDTNTHFIQGVVVFSRREQPLGWICSIFELRW